MSTKETVSLVLFLLAIALLHLRYYLLRTRFRFVVLMLHRRGMHSAAHLVREQLLPGALPTKEELDLERRMPEGP